MVDREELARRLCELNGVNPDNKGSGLGRFHPVGETYFLWEYWAKYYVDPMLEMLKDDLK